VWQYVAVAVTAGVVTAAVTPLVARLARRLGAMDHPGGPRKIHRYSTPTLGGIAMLFGFLAAIVLASLLGDFQALFATTSEPVALVVGCLVIVAIGIADDLVGLPPTVKLAGQIVAALVVAVFGIQLTFFWIPGIPGVDILVLSPDLGLPLTVLALVAMINAVNLIDGLDGLAAGVSAIAGGAFFLFALRSGMASEAIPSSAPLVAAIVVGVAVGFLVHNWHPARIFMGDTGAMLLGLLLGAGGVSYVGRTPAPSEVDFYGAMPLLIPALVLAVPFLDTAFAVLRRIVRRTPVSLADREHLHHRLLRMGHSHRRAVLVLYYWSAVAAFGSVAPIFLSPLRVLPYAVVACLVGAIITIAGMQRRPSAGKAAVAPPEEERTGTG
jgi:UDP-GlcNAc:undecaprenyl-phosphate/decaprenyl-phosphate GlcNAc-1-phosphate transferase